MGSLISLTDALDREETDYRNIIYKSIVEGIKSYNLDAQRIKRVVNEELRYRLIDETVTLPNDIADLITHLVPAIRTKDAEAAFHFASAILMQIVKTLSGNFKSMKHTRAFTELQKHASRILKVFFGIAEESHDDGIIIRSCSISLLRVVLGAPGSLNNHRGNEEGDDDAIDENEEDDEHGNEVGDFGKITSPASNLFSYS